MFPKKPNNPEGNRVYINKKYPKTLIPLSKN